jgi:hypothetical protein
MNAGRDRAIAVALAAFVIATRLPFVTRILWEWDSVLYARALEQGFHVSAGIGDQRPHPPGYLFYVAISAAFRAVLGDSNTALVAVAIVASSGATVLVYLLARRFARAELAAFAALAFAVDPLVWAHGEIALPYIVLALGSCGLALLFWDARAGSERRAIAASLAFGLAAGFRQDLLLLLGPLWLWAMAAGGPRRIATGAVAAAVACPVWLIPSAILSGGLGPYVSAVLSQSGSITGKSVVGASGGDVLWYDVRFTVLALAWGLFAVGVVLLGLLVAPALHWARRPRIGGVGDRGAFFLLWLVPGLVVYVAWIIGDWGYVLSILPGLYVLCAALLERALGTARGTALLVWRTFALALIAGTAVVFVVTGARWSQVTLASHDEVVRARVAYIRVHLEPGATVLLAREDYQQARYYLAEYRAWLYDPANATSRDPKKDPAGSAVVIFTPGLVLRQQIAVLGVNVGGEDDRLMYVPAPATGILLFGVDPIAREP